VTTPYAGGCACGAIRYESEAEPIVAAHCQCRDCQRQGGAAHASLLAFPGPSLRVTGEPRWYETRADSGNLAGRGFCPGCGSWLFFRTSRRPAMIALTAGSLDDPRRFVPQFIVYTSSAQPWDVVDLALPIFPQSRPA
jgi:hypothetical protein